MGLVREVLDALGVATCELAGWEADDLIATATEQAVARGDDVVIVTGDRDAYQLVSDPHVKVLYNRRGVSDYALYDEAGIFERTGVTPAQYPEYAVAARRPQRQPARRARRRGEDGGQADQHVRRARRHLRQRRRADAEAAGLAGRARGAHPQEPPGDDPAPGRAGRAARVAGDDAERRRGQAAVRLPRVPHVRRAAGRRARARPPSCSRPTSASSSSPRSATSESAAATARAARRRWPPSTSPPRGTASPAAARCAAWPSSPTATTAAVTWIPADHLADPAVAAALAAAAVRGHDTKPLMRSLLMLGIELDQLELDTAIAAYLLEPAESRYELPAPDRALHPLRRPGRRAGGQGPARPRRHAGRPGRRRRPPGAGRAPPRRADPDPPRRATAWPSCTAPSRTRSCGCWPGWSTPASPSTAASCASSTPGSTADVLRLGNELKVVVGRDDLNINSPIQLREILYAAPPAGRGLTPIKKTKTGASTDAATLEKLRDEWPEFIAPLLQYREVEKLRGHVRRGPAGRGRRRRADPRHVQPDRRPHRPAQLGQAEPAQHPGAPGGGPAVPQGVRRRAGRQAARRRLQPDRAALHRPPRRRSRAWSRRSPAARTSTTPPRRGSSASPRSTSRWTSARRPRWCPTAWPTAWRPTGSASG